MAPSWFLILLKCIDFLSWPVLALVYPLCASIEAIENDTHSDTRNLISYWILLSLIYLFEYAFLKLLQWFQYWHYMKLIIVTFLVTPDFGRAAYVYNQVIRSCIYMKTQAVVSRFRNMKNMFVKKEEYIMQAEKYITQNGTEALERLIAGKNTEPSLHAETRKVVPTTTEKNEILKTNKGMHLMEQKDIKDLEIIEKEEVPEGKQTNTALERLKSNESTSSATAKTEKMLVGTEHGTHPWISASENVQKEWTRAICQLTMPSEANLNSHLQGRKHQAACEALETKSKVTSVIDRGTGASPQVSAYINEQTKWTCDICQMTMPMPSKANFKAHQYGKKHKAACEALNTKSKVTLVANTGTGASSQVSTCINDQTKWTCDICQMTMPSEANFKAHQYGKKHKAAFEALNTKSKVTLVTDTGTGTSPQVSTCINEQAKWTCEVCQMTMPSKANFKAHQYGKKHKAACEALNPKSQLVAEKGLPKKNDKSIGEQEKVINTSNATLNHPHMEHKNMNQQNKNRYVDANSKVQELNKNVGISVGMNSCNRFRCDMCNANCTSEGDLASHLQGKRHLAQIQPLSGHC